MHHTYIYLNQAWVALISVSLTSEESLPPTPILIINQYNNPSPSMLDSYWTDYPIMDSVFMVGVFFYFYRPGLAQSGSGGTAIDIVGWVSW